MGLNDHEIGWERNSHLRVLLRQSNCLLSAPVQGAQKGKLAGRHKPTHTHTLCATEARTSVFHSLPLSILLETTVDTDLINTTCFYTVKILANSMGLYCVQGASSNKVTVWGTAQTMAVCIRRHSSISSREMCNRSAITVLALLLYPVVTCSGFECG